MNNQFGKSKTRIAGVLKEFFAAKQQELTPVNSWGSDLVKRFETFALSGKMLRGCLTMLAYEMFKGDATSEVIQVATSMEIIQSSLLIHDDIMDRDIMRRGNKTIFAQYGENHYGESMGICVGDIGFFWAFELLSQAPSEVRQLISMELAKVGVAQMQDVSIEQQKKLATKDELFNLYRYKTARYTFSLPLMVGAMMAGAHQKSVKTLEKLGEALGIMFQLKDDELDREEKPISMNTEGTALEHTSIKLIQSLTVSQMYKDILSELLEYNKTRTA